MDLGFTAVPTFFSKAQSTAPHFLRPSLYRSISVDWQIIRLGLHHLQLLLFQQDQSRFLLKLGLAPFKKPFKCTEGSFRFEALVVGGLPRRSSYYCSHANHRALSATLDQSGNSTEVRINLIILCFTAFGEERPPPYDAGSEPETSTAPAVPPVTLSPHQLPSIDQTRAVIADFWQQHDMVGRGYNPVHGFDTTGPPPPGSNPGQPTRAPGAHYSAFFSGPAPSALQQPTFGYPSGFSSTLPVLVPPSYPFPSASYAAVNPGFPAVCMQAGTCAPPSGYTYLYHREHCRFHVFKTPRPPWQHPVSKADPATHAKLLIPTNITVKELMQNLGCDNPDAKKNKLYELAEVGDGRWSKGLTMCGADKERMKKITDFGWDATRTGKPGEKPVVWLWLTKD